MPRCPLCGSADIEAYLDHVTFRPERRGYCLRCDLEWNLEEPAEPEPVRPPEAWPARVLLEMADPALGAAVEATLQTRGHTVAMCGGPRTLPGGRCPLVDGMGCPLAEEATVIVLALGVGDPSGRAILDAHRGGHPGKPTAVVCNGAIDVLALPRGYEVIAGDLLTEEGIVDSVSRLLRPRKSRATVARDEFGQGG